MQQAKIMPQYRELSAFRAASVPPDLALDGGVRLTVDHPDSDAEISIEVPAIAVPGLYENVVLIPEPLRRDLGFDVPFTGDLEAFSNLWVKVEPIPMELPEGMPNGFDVEAREPCDPDDPAYAGPRYRLRPGGFIILLGPKPMDPPDDDDDDDNTE